MRSKGLGASRASSAFAVPVWLVLVVTPFAAAAAFAIGGAERTSLQARLAAAVAAAAQGISSGGGGIGLALLLVFADIAAVALALGAFRRGLVRRVQMDAGFPLVQLSGLVCANVLSAACSLAVGAVTVWACVLTVCLWVFQGPPEYWEGP